jgi:hypothetical protein
MVRQTPAFFFRRQIKVDEVPAGAAPSNRQTISAPIQVDPAI